MDNAIEQVSKLSSENDTFPSFESLVIIWSGLVVDIMSGLFGLMFFMLNGNSNYKFFIKFQKC